MAPDNSMERTRFFRRPVVWIILVIIGVIALSSIFTSGPSYQRVDTSVALDRLNQPGIKKVVQKDKEQTLQLELTKRATGGTSSPGFGGASTGGNHVPTAPPKHSYPAT